LFCLNEKSGAIGLPLDGFHGLIFFPITGGASLPASTGRFLFRLLILGPGLLLIL
jgi:hypothetical protein